MTAPQGIGTHVYAVAAACDFCAEAAQYVQYHFSVLLAAAFRFVQITDESSAARAKNMPAKL